MRKTGYAWRDYLPFQRQGDVLSGECTGAAATGRDDRPVLSERAAQRVEGPAKARGEQTGAGGDRNDNELPAVDLIGRRHPFRRSEKLHRPHLSTVGAIVRAEPAVRPGGEEDQAAGGHQRSTTREERAGVRWNPQLGRGEDSARRNPPVDLSRVQVIPRH